MNKIKNIRQAFSLMRKKFPDEYIAVKTELHGSGKAVVQKRVYSASPGGGHGHGVSGNAETWDDAFAELDEDVKLAEAVESSND